MRDPDIVITLVTPAEIDGFLDYLEPHLADNGLHGNALFQPFSRREPWRRADKAPKMLQSWTKAVGEPGWSRAWLARAAASARIVGHVDLRARSEPGTAHRALIGAGVHADARRVGIATTMMRHMVDWARSESSLEWLDLHVLGGNLPAQRLYESLGFQRVASVEDMFRIDGESIADVIMSMKLRA